jgi:ammonia channel protein AmtB
MFETLLMFCSTVVGRDDVNVSERMKERYFFHSLFLYSVIVYSDIEHWVWLWDVFWNLVLRIFEWGAFRGVQASNPNRFECNFFAFLGGN